MSIDLWRAIMSMLLVILVALLLMITRAEGASA